MGLKAVEEVGLRDLVVDWKSRIQAWATGSLEMPWAEGENRSDPLFPSPIALSCPVWKLPTETEDW